jgi:hypothetical protein
MVEVERFRTPVDIKIFGVKQYVYVATIKQSARKYTTTIQSHDDKASEPLKINGPIICTKSPEEALAAHQTLVIALARGDISCAATGIDMTIGPFSPGEHAKDSSEDSGDE